MVGAAHVDERNVSGVLFVDVDERAPELAMDALFSAVLTL